VSRPDPSDYDASYATYVDQVPAGRILSILADQAGAPLARLQAIPEQRAGQPCAPGKWTVKETVLHLSDAERIFACRALRIARADTTPLPGFEQDDYAATGGANARSWADIVAEMATVRAATVSLFRGLPPAAWDRRGTANNCPVTVRALAYIIAGHFHHHLRILAEYGL